MFTARASDILPTLDTKVLLLIVRYNQRLIHFFKWINYFDYVMELFDVPNDLKGQYLLFSVDVIALWKIRLKIDPVDPTVLSYEVIVSILQEIYAPMDKDIAARLYFNARFQFEGESIKHYVSALKKLSVPCNFGDILDNILLRQFIRGLINQKIVNRLTNIENLDIDKAMFIAHETEIKELCYKLGREEY
ncbi:hypothetical protein M0804_013856 [Polistes exclamans]|nr:hypothetical protein M0804_013856 [Polistes exclamans]